MDVEEDEKLNNRELMDTEAGEQSSENDDDIENEIDNEDEDEDEEKEDDKESADFVNPLLGDDESEDSKDDDEEEQWSSDGDRYDNRVVEQKERGSKRLPIGSKRSKPD